MCKSYRALRPKYFSFVLGEEKLSLRIFELHFGYNKIKNKGSYCSIAINRLGEDGAEVVDKTPTSPDSTVCFTLPVM